MPALREERTLRRAGQIEDGFAGVHVKSVDAYFSIRRTGGLES